MGMSACACFVLAYTFSPSSSLLLLILCVYHRPPQDDGPAPAAPVSAAQRKGSVFVDRSHQKESLAAFEDNVTGE
jgi:hypothetical protein